MNKQTSHIILHVERAANDLRRDQPIILVREGGARFLVSAGEYAPPEADCVQDSAHPAVKLMKIGGLLPKAVLQAVPQEQGDFLSVTEAEIQDYPAQLAASLEKVSEANVPLEDAEQARIVAFRPRFGHQEHLAIIIGEPQKDEAAYVRLHSSCITGDVLGSLRCDCGDQLRQALAIIGERKSGAVLYLNQEGRGISIANKLRAYQLQDEGMDTVEANEALGFLADERDFAVAAEMLKQLDITKVVLLTNNPGKMKALAAQGIEVVRREPVVTEANAHNRKYLDTKASKMGHHLKDKHG
ncbi:MAG TPA: GTP cyclohydrolase II [Rickettsiales bacterium]|nr:GTP cyclohydrolase II [Rickettsiales bacterium]